MEKKIPVAAGIIIKDQKILCAQRDRHRSLAYKWEFPGGKVETGETTRQTVIRELHEELEIEAVVSDEPYDYTEYSYDFGRVCLTTYLTHIQEGEPVRTEHEAFRWMKREDLDQLDWAPADWPTVHKLMEEGWEN